MPKKYIDINSFLPILKRWHILLCESGIDTKIKVRKEIHNTITKLEESMVTTDD